MTEQQWLACEGPRAMLDYLESRNLETDSKVTAWIIACREAYKAGRIAAGKGGIEFKATPRSCLTSWMMLMDDGVLPFEDRCQLIREIWGNPFRPIYRAKTGNIGYGYCEKCGNAKHGIKACMCDIYPVFARQWLTPKVITMAKLIHGTQDWDLMPIFADLLEDAGCDNEDVLRHARNEERHYPCRIEMINFDAEGKLVDVNVVPPHPRCVDCKGTGWIPARAPHIRGCWLISLILGEG